ncbi:MAG TPA: OB-fold domain-containing protein [Solirubrobacterales bacterium]|jgi:hypothetical protein|nr:OB-fold domain-containing protein [Solirubrobacterales bacterium]
MSADLFSKGPDRDYAKPLPILTATNRPYWEAAARHEFQLQRCSACRSWIYPISVVCQSCGAQDDYVWTSLSGRATLSSWAVYRRAFAPFEPADVPYAVAEVELEEGVRLVSHVVDAEIAEYRAGLALRVAFRDLTPAISLVVFAPLSQRYNDYHCNEPTRPRGEILEADG